MRRIIEAAAVIWAAVLLALPAVAQEDASSLIDGAIKSLDCVAFQGDAKSLPQGMMSRFAVVNRVVHIPPDLYRVDPMGPGSPPFFFIENESGSFKVDKQTQQVVPLKAGRLREGEVFLSKFLQRLKGHGDLKVESISFLSRPGWRITHSNKFLISVVVDDATKFPLKYEVVGPGGRLMIYHEFISISFIASPASVDPATFRPPADYEQLKPLPRTGERVDLFPNWQRKEASEPEFLPLIPTYYPPGFELTSVAPVRFKGNLIFHLQMRDSDRDAVISVFESKNPRMEQVAERGRRRPRGLNVHHRHKNGIYVLIIGRMSQSVLKRIGDSLDEDDVLAFALLEHEGRHEGSPGPPPPGGPPPGQRPPR
jgi:hypothetical protein